MPSQMIRLALTNAAIAFCLGCLPVAADQRRASRQSNNQTKPRKLIATMKLGVSPSWVMSSSFHKQYLKGQLKLQYEWSLAAAQKVFPIGSKSGIVDLRPLPTVTNFADGASGRVMLGGVRKIYQKLAATIIYTGHFKQRVSSKCYPFDDVTAKFIIKLFRPLKNAVHLHLFCDCSIASNCEEVCTSYDKSGKLIAVNPPYAHDQLGLVDKIVRNNTVVAEIGFEWQEFSCEKQHGKGGQQVIICQMKAVRDPYLMIFSDLIPGIVMIMVGFGSFWIPPNMAMPRVATVMISMLTFIGKGTSVLAKAPTTGPPMNWFGVFFISGSIVQFFNLIGHVTIFRFGEQARLLTHINRAPVFFAYMLFLSVDLHNRECAHVSTTFTLAMIVIWTSLLVISSLGIAYTFRAQFKRCQHWKSHSQLADPTDEDHAAEQEKLQEKPEPVKLGSVAATPDSAQQPSTTMLL